MVSCTLSPCGHEDCGMTVSTGTGIMWHHPAGIPSQGRGSTRKLTHARSFLNPSSECASKMISTCRGQQNRQGGQQSQLRHALGSPDREGDAVCPPRAPPHTLPFGANRHPFYMPSPTCTPASTMMGGTPISCGVVTRLWISR